MSIQYYSHLKTVYVTSEKEIGEKCFSSLKKSAEIGMGKPGREGNRTFMWTEWAREKEGASDEETCLTQ